MDRVYKRHFFSETGRNDLWIYQNNINSRSINKYVKSVLIDQNLQYWHGLLQNSQKGRNYSIIKQDIMFEKYLTTIQRNYWLSSFKFRTDNHKFPVETGRWNAVEYADRKCNLCNLSDVGDKYHDLLLCPYFTTDRKLHIYMKYYSRPNIIKYQELMAISDKSKLEKLSRFIKIFMTKFSTI